MSDWRQDEAEFQAMEIELKEWLIRHGDHVDCLQQLVWATAVHTVYVAGPGPERLDQGRALVKRLFDEATEVIMGGRPVDDQAH